MKRRLEKGVRSFHPKIISPQGYMSKSPKLKSPIPNLLGQSLLKLEETKLIEKQLANLIEALRLTSLVVERENNRRPNNRRENNRHLNCLL